MMPYMESMMKLQETLLLSGLKHDFLFIKGESLVQRARNNAVCSFMGKDFERLLFIDSDLEFNPENVETLWNLDKPVCCGSYPMKKKGIKTTAWKDGGLVNLDELNGPTEVDYAATGFMMVKKYVFEQMKEFYPLRAHKEGHPEHFKQTRDSFSWFDPRVDTVKDIYLSEDYAFSQDWRNMGGKIILDPSIRLKHWGFHGYA